MKNLDKHIETNNQLIEPATQVELTKNNLPPFTKGQFRNSFGLLENVDYVFTPEGFVDWRKMVPHQHLVLNAAKQEHKEKLAAKYGKKFEEISVEEAEDGDLLILLAGTKEVLNIRGFESVDYTTLYQSADVCSVKCTIRFAANYETAYRVVEFSSIADATALNTKDWATRFLTTIAENRAFTRCVRNFLRIHIVGQEEVNDSADIKQDQSAAAMPTPHAKIEEIMKEKNITFEQLKNRSIKVGLEGAETWNNVQDIPKDKALEVVGVLNKKEKK